MRDLSHREEWAGENAFSVPDRRMAGEGKNSLLGGFGQGGWGRRKNSQKDTEPEQAAGGKGKGVCWSSASLGESWIPYFSEFRKLGVKRQSILNVFACVHD